MQPSAIDFACCRGEEEWVRRLPVETLLGRSLIRPDLSEVFRWIEGKTVLVTGGGGTIGSEICRQIAPHRPKRLILFDVCENSAFRVQMELKRTYPELALSVLIGSVRDSRRLDEIFSRYRPQIVYHAAAHKHVPLMEDSPNEAIKNNAVGTYKTAFAAVKHGCEHFVLISTDKAVNPTSVMGASKRLCEMIIQAFDRKIRAGKAEEIASIFTHSAQTEEKLPAGARTEFAAVRFGNVLGSSGSVLPLFLRQIAEGGPVTVTHPEIIRYFMTVEEAVSLVLIAGSFARGGEIFVLDMGKPVKIDSLAKNLIRLCGKEPGKEIEVRYIGLRQGEKLFEEKLMAEEGILRTENDLIHIGRPIPFETDSFLKELEQLMIASYNNDESIREKVAKIVTTYRPKTLKLKKGEEQCPL